MPTTYIGSIYQKYNKDLNEWVTHYLRTHANAVITTEDRTFVSEEQKEFLSSLMGDGSGTEGTAYGELVNKVNILEQFKVGIEDLFTEGIGSTTIDQLHEIVNFVSGSNISEGMTLGQFINSLNKLKINNQSIAGIDYSIYAPTSAGTAGYVLKSNGSGAPTWTNNLTLTSLVVNTDITVGGKLLGYLKDIGTSESPFGDAYVNSIRSNQIYANGKNVTSMKNAVTKATQPTAEDYGRNELVDGLVWVDIGTVAPSVREFFHNISIRYVKPSSTDLATNSNFLKSFFDKAGFNTVRTAYTNGKTYPVLEFETPEGPMGITIDYNKGEYNPNHYFDFKLRKTVNTPYDTVVASFINVYGSSEDGYYANASSSSTHIIPAGRLVANNLHLFGDIAGCFLIQTSWESSS